jgi:hypothetical protein
LLFVGGYVCSIIFVEFCDKIESIVVESFKHSRKSLFSNKDKKSSFELVDKFVELNKSLAIADIRLLSLDVCCLVVGINDISFGFCGSELNNAAK